MELMFYGWSGLVAAAETVFDVKGTLLGLFTLTGVILRWGNQQTTPAKVASVCRKVRATINQISETEKSSVIRGKMKMKMQEGPKIVANCWLHIYCCRILISH